MKPGMRLKSAACDTEVMVIRGSGVTVACGGVSMGEQRPDEAAILNADFSGGTQMGKRYVDAANTVELLCVKAGEGSLSIDGVALELKTAKPLPSSD